MNALLLTLSGMFRSWGGVAVGDDRPTDWAPTQSAVIGLAGALVGLRRGDPAVGAFYAGYEVWAATGPRLAPTGQEGLEAGGLAYDFQTVADSKGGDGNVRSESIVSQRAYLADWVDAVALVARPNAPVPLDVLAERALTPAFPLYLGRKAFPLGDDLAPELFDREPVDLAHALWARYLDEKARGHAEKGRLWLPSHAIQDLPGFCPHRERRSDVRQSYGFGERTVSVWRPLPPTVVPSFQDPSLWGDLRDYFSDAPGDKA